MSYLLHGHIAMGWVDPIPRCPRLYIGGLYALYQTDLIAAAGITHVLSVIDYDALLQEKFQELKHFHIRAEDDPNVDLLCQFGNAVKWVDAALRDGGGVCTLRHGQESQCDPRHRVPDVALQHRLGRRAGMGA
jgi:dual specificity phosphatase 12